MSGSGSSGFSSFERNDVDCKKLVFEAQIASPQQAVVNGLKHNDILQVTLENIGTTMAVTLKHQGQLAGGVASPHVQRLRQCIEEGIAYKAEVISINGAHISIRITAA